MGEKRLNNIKLLSVLEELRLRTLFYVVLLDKPKNKNKTICGDIYDIQNCVKVEQKLPVNTGVLN